MKVLILQLPSPPGEQEARFEIRCGVLTNKDKAYLTDLDSLPPRPSRLAPLSKYWYYAFGRGGPCASVFAWRASGVCLERVEGWPLIVPLSS